MPTRHKGKGQDKTNTAGKKPEKGKKTVVEGQYRVGSPSSIGDPDILLSNL